jgi:hypothetical protein
VLGGFLLLSEAGAYASRCRYDVSVLKEDRDYSGKNVTYDLSVYPSIHSPPPYGIRDTNRSSSPFTIPCRSIWHTPRDATIINRTPYLRPLLTPEMTASIRKPPRGFIRFVLDWNRIPLWKATTLTFSLHGFPKLLRGGGGGFCQKLECSQLARCFCAEG